MPSYSAATFSFGQRNVILAAPKATGTLGVSVQAVLASVLVLVGTFSQIIAYFIFVTVAFIAASVAALYRLPPPASGYRTPWRRVMPGVFVAFSLLLMAMLLMGRPLQAVLGVAVVMAGVPAYLWVGRSRAVS